MRKLKWSAPSFLNDLYKALNYSMEYHKGKNEQYNKIAFASLKLLSNEIDALVDKHEYSMEKD
ncbi:MAG: hypothetical protein LBP19_05170 [Treponema sp.]|jgi:hypothetical protein|nr:hypothetical protein [Treponema sp.]